MVFAIFLLVLSILIVVHEFGHFIMAKRMGVRVERFSLGFGYKLFSKKIKDTEYNICAMPLGGYVKLAGDNLEEYKGDSAEFLAQAPGRRFRIIFFGPFLNYVLGFLSLWLVLFIGYPTIAPVVGGLIDELGAKDAGMQIGDRIVAIDGRRLEDWEELQKTVQGKKFNAKVQLDILRNNQERKIEVEIRQKDLKDILGQKRTVGVLGITPSDEIIKIRHGFMQSFLLAVNKTYEITVLTYRAIWRMLTGQLSFRESVTGPLGMFYITSQAISVGISAVIHLIALLSISLCIFNLLPLPVLDGGHIILLIVEKIRGKYLSKKFEEVFTRFGMALIITVACLVFYNDLMRFGVIERISQWWAK